MRMSAYLVGSAYVAEALGISQRQVQRLRVQLGGKFLADRLVFPLDRVEAFAADRELMKGER
jgi:hypothetical protein